MNTRDILERIVNVHNSLAQVSVSGNGAIIMGQSLVELRTIVQALSEKCMEEERDKLVPEGAD